MNRINGIINFSNTILATVFLMVLLSLLLLVGLLTPLIFRLATGAEMSLDADYFNARTAIPTLILVILLNICALLVYAGPLKALAVAAGGIFLSAISYIVSPFSNVILDVSIPILGVATGALIISMLYSGTGVYRGSASGVSDLKMKVRKLGPHVIHLGVVLILLGVVISSGAKVEESGEFSLDVEGTLEKQNYIIKITQMDSYYEGAPYNNYPASSYVTDIYFDIYSGNEYFDTGHVRYITDFKWGQSYTTTYIHRSISEEIFIAPRAIDVADEKVSLYVRTVPFISFVWIGMVLLGIGISMILLAEKKLKLKEVRNSSELKIKRNN